MFTCRIISLATTVLPKSKNDDEGTEDAGRMKSVAEKIVVSLPLVIESPG